ncbi:2-acylglycerol O-acyltransferase 2-A-like [Saccoglossus kowalevskii]|uniref:2-acylglycerol O-acyltransferase 2-A-like n=1 Tax=Saccoglossus kowalevskii TaxID=10224 RepID=A0ABM0GTU7_SACKO|nr:PREDICTED: 2-acylglycerol O-acyltransferase 2-A-like [Saccoglossus kowalevskii]
MTKILGIELAPLNIPLSRRLQTLGALKYVLSFLVLGFGCLFISIYVLLFTRYYWVILLYLLWMYYDWNTPKRGGRRRERYRRWVIFDYMRDYFPISLIKTADLDPKHNYLLGFHPHGIMSAGAFCNFGSEATGFSEKYPGITPYLITLVGQFWFPFHRDYIMQSGVCDCSKESLTYLLEESGTGNAVVLVVGGAIESLEAHEGSTTVHLTKRKGFIKLALKTGLVTSAVHIKQFGGMSFGKPIVVDKIKEPSKEDIDRLHASYMKALTDLFDTHKVNYANYKDKELEIL